MSEPTPVEGGRASLREEQRNATRQRILAACAELALRHGGLADPDKFTFARVAALAGVSERTVYRMFPTKRELSRAFLEEGTLTGGRSVPDNAAGLADFLRDVTREMDASLERPSLGAVPSPGEDDDASALAAQDRAGRDDALHHAVADLTHRLDDTETNAVAGVLRHLFSIRGVAETASRWQVSLTDAGEAHAWAIGTLVRALEEGEPQPWRARPDHR